MNRIRQTVRNWMGLSTVRPTPVGASARFVLKRGDQEIGWLSVADGTWNFQYSSDFGERTGLRPLVEFPDINRVYSSDELWPFFGTRIPSLKQSQVRRILQKEGIDEGDELQLLRRFGRRTLANPFELVEDTGKQSARTPEPSLQQ